MAVGGEAAHAAVDVAVPLVVAGMDVSILAVYTVPDVRGESVLR